MVALISAIGFILAGVLVELSRSRRQASSLLKETIDQQKVLNLTLDKLNETLHTVDKRLVAVETTVKLANGRSAHAERE